MRPCASTLISPRLPGVRPAAPRFRSAVLLWRPAATSTSFNTNVAPDVSVSVTPPAGGALHCVTFSFQIKCTPAAVMARWTLLEISRSRKLRSESRPSIKMHFDTEGSESTGIFRFDHACAHRSQEFRPNRARAGVRKETREDARAMNRWR